MFFFNGVYIVAMSAHSPNDIRVVVPDLVVSLSASLFIDMSCHFSSGQELNSRRLQWYQSKSETVTGYTVIKQLSYTVDDAHQQTRTYSVTPKSRPPHQTRRKKSSPL